VPVFHLTKALSFPSPDLAEEDGLLAVGGDLSPERLLLAYANGIFPWYSRDPILWWSPPERPVVAPGAIHVGRSLAKAMRRAPYELKFDSAFDDVIAACALTKRPGQRGTWITPAMREAYGRLHALGVAHSAEAWQDGQLVGGLYGVALGGAFFGESMFARAPDASKLAFVALCRHLEAWGFGLIDSQVTNDHTERFGTVEIPRSEFLARIRAEQQKPGRPGLWTFEPALLENG
jgi:leucyl/phenylalanyl-tRNA--protein transferase